MARQQPAHGAGDTPTAADAGAADGSAHDNAAKMAGVVGDAAPPARDATTSAPDHPERVRRQIYGRRVGPKLRPTRQVLLDTLLPRLQLDATRPIAPHALFGARPLWLEIGFGAGEHLAEQAAAHPEIGLIGVEPFLNGVAALLAQIEARDLDNLRIVVDDARLVLAHLPDASVVRLFVLFPDPWPKARHHKRRIVNAATLADMARVMAPGAELRFATDHMGYARWVLELMQRQSAFVWQAARARDWRERPEDWPATRYERKRLTGVKPVYLRFTRQTA